LTVRKFSESKIGVGIGDVVGKGISAALLMANLQASFRAFASEVLYPFRSTVLTSFAAFAVQKLLMSSRHRLPLNHVLRNRRKAKS
jgi:serine phosphatase RsbU (regulator of sigma subunit)